MPTSTQLGIGRVIRDVGLIELIANAGGVLVGLMLGGSLTTEEGINAFLGIVLILGTILLIVGFFISGVRIDAKSRWQHLTRVAIGVIVVTLVLNSLLLNAAISGLGVLISVVQTFLAMAIGGAAANAFKRS